MKTTLTLIALAAIAMVAGPAAAQFQERSLRLSEIRVRNADGDRPAVRRLPFGY